MTQPLRIGIAGYGVVGKRRRNVADRRDDMKVVAVCDQYFDGPGEMEDGVRHYPHYRDLLTEDLDALFVSISNDMGRGGHRRRARTRIARVLRKTAGAGPE